MNLQEYNRKMGVLLVELCELEEQQATIHIKTDKIEEAAKALRFEYITDGDVL